jgi:hypothetical protein
MRPNSVPLCTPELTFLIIKIALYVNNVFASCAAWVYNVVSYFQKQKCVFYNKMVKKISRYENEEVKWAIQHIP